MAIGVYKTVVFQNAHFKACGSQSRLAMPFKPSANRAILKSQVGGRDGWWCRLYIRIWFWRFFYPNGCAYQMACAISG